MNAYLRISLAGIALSLFSVAAADGLPSWNEGAAKTAIVDFVERVKDPESEQFVPIGERSACQAIQGPLGGVGI